LTFTLISTPLLVSRSEALPTLLPAPSLICACAWFYTMAFAASYVIAVLFVLVVAANDDDQISHNVKRGCYPTKIPFQHSLPSQIKYLPHPDATKDLLR
jgi:hypothetical protein